MNETPKGETTMLGQQYQGQKWQGTAAEKKALMVNVAHLLNKLRGYADEVECPLTGAEEDTFWQFISTLPLNEQSSVIN
jgi:hypothetical protein